MKVRTLRTRYRAALTAPLPPRSSLPEILSPHSERVLLFEVHHALSNGLDEIETAALLGVSSRRVRALKIKAASITAHTFDKQTQEYLARRFWVGCQARIDEGWKVYHKTRDDHAKLKALVVVHTMEQDQIKMAQSLGLVGKYDGVNDSDSEGRALALLERYHASLGSVGGRGGVSQRKRDPSPVPHAAAETNLQ